jgi:hypothetical protein
MIVSKHYRYALLDVILLIRLQNAFTYYDIHGLV